VHYAALVDSFIVVWVSQTVNNNASVSSLSTQHHPLPSRTLKYQQKLLTVSRKANKLEMVQGFMEYSVSYWELTAGCHGDSNAFEMIMNYSLVVLNGH
jgi:hypothetical protein